MQVTKRERKSIIIHILLYSFLLGLLCYFVLTYFYPKILFLEDRKQEVKKLYKAIEQIEKIGIDFDEFQKLANKVEKSLYVSEVLKNIKKDFYLENLSNTEFNEFSEFLNDKKLKLNSDDIKNILMKRDKKIVNILPSYSDTYVGRDGDSLTDLKFINYIESLIETFGLSYRDSIGIANLVLIDDFISQNTSEKSLETNLFYIPVKLTLTGKKLGIVQFLHYIENVGKIYEGDKDIEIYKDKFLYRNGRKIVLEGDNLKPNYLGLQNYNIYENQIIDIANFRIKQYIDSSSKQRGTQSMVDFIKNTQADQKMVVEVELHFYVKGVPHYKLETFIKETLQKYDELVKAVNLRLKDTRLSSHITNKLINIKAYLKEIDKDIIEMKKGLKAGGSLQNFYRKAINYDTIFKTYHKQLKK